MGRGRETTVRILLTGPPDAARDRLAAAGARIVDDRSEAEVVCARLQTITSPHAAELASLALPIVVLIDGDVVDEADRLAALGEGIDEVVALDAPPDVLRAALAGARARAQGHAGPLRLRVPLLELARRSVAAQLARLTAHEMGNLLLGVTGNVELLLEDIRDGRPLDPEAGEMLADVAEAARQAARLNSELHAFCRPDRGGPPGLRLEALVARLEPLLRRVLGSRIQLTTQLPDAAQAVAATEAEARQVLLTLLLNVRRALPEGGRCEVTVGPGPELAGRATVRLTVTDDGQGLPALVHCRRRSTFLSGWPEEPAPGLGLAAARWLLEQSGGGLTLAGPSEGGARVHADWPRQPEHALEHE